MTIYKIPRPKEKERKVFDEGKDWKETLNIKNSFVYVNPQKSTHFLITAVYGDNYNRDNSWNVRIVELGKITAIHSFPSRIKAHNFAKDYVKTH